MNETSTELTDRTEIVKVLEVYLAGARSGRGDDMRPAFHQDATVFGYVASDLFGGPIAKLYAWNDENGPATGLQVSIASVDVEGTAATARVELDNWTGNRFTDLFTLLKVEGEWKIMNKVFHLHATQDQGAETNP